MRITCFNCQGARYVWNGWRNIACPVCGNRGECERVEQADFFGESKVIYTLIRPDRKKCKRMGVPR